MVFALPNHCQQSLDGQHKWCGYGGRRFCEFCLRGFNYQPHHNAIDEACVAVTLAIFTKGYPVRDICLADMVALAKNRGLEAMLEELMDDAGLLNLPTSSMRRPGSAWLARLYYPKFHEGVPQ